MFENVALDIFSNFFCQPPSKMFGKCQSETRARKFLESSERARCLADAAVMQRFDNVFHLSLLNISL